MNFVWDMVIRAGNQGISEEELFFSQAKEYSPFYEQAFSHLNEKEMRPGNVELNLLLRFASIFQEILAENDEGLEEFQRYLIDAGVHLLLHTDLRHGLTIRELYIVQIMSEMEKGIICHRLADEFDQIPREKKSRITSLMLSQIQMGSSVQLFGKGMKIVFPDVVIYQIRDHKHELILYLKEKKTRQREKLVLFIQDMFLPIHYGLRVFWEHHFGIIGVEETMKIDEIAIY